MALLETLTRSILATRSDAIIATDRDGFIRFWNPGAERIFGHASSEALGQSLDLIIPERLRARHWSGYREVMQTGQSRYGEGDLLAVPGIRRDGTKISLEFTIVPLFDAERRLQGVAAVMRDVSERFDEMQALKRKLAQLSAPGGAAPSGGAAQ
jgi:PAS domain S-box-containing protein